MKMNKLTSTLLSLSMISSIFAVTTSAAGFDENLNISGNIKVVDIVDYADYESDPSSSADLWAIFEISATSENFVTATSYTQAGKKKVKDVLGIAGVSAEMKLNSEYFNAVADMVGSGDFTLGGAEATVAADNYKLKYGFGVSDGLKYFTGATDSVPCLGQFVVDIDEDYDNSNIEDDDARQEFIDTLNGSLGELTGLQFTVKEYVNKSLTREENYNYGSIDGVALGVDSENLITVTFGDPAGGDVAVTGVTLDQSAVELDLNGTKTATLVATVTPDNATDPTVTWTSSNTDVATVVNGVVTAVGKGEATITAKAGDFSATCAVTVVDTTPATSGKGTVTTEDATDAAEWAWDTVTGAGNAVEVTVVANDTTYKKTFTLGASVENAGATKIGVILQYDPTVFTSGISITGINLVNAN